MLWIKRNLFIVIGLAVSLVLLGERDTTFITASMTMMIRTLP